MRFFNTEGPVRPDKRYAIQPLDRVDVDEFLGLSQAERYFVLHAPRQTGKTSALIMLRDLLNSSKAGDFRYVDVDGEVGQVVRDDVAEGIRAILSSLALSAQATRRRLPGRHLAGHAGQGGRQLRFAAGAYPLVPSRPYTAGAAGDEPPWGDPDIVTVELSPYDRKRLTAPDACFARVNPGLPVTSPVPTLRMEFNELHLARIRQPPGQERGASSRGPTAALPSTAKAGGCLRPGHRQEIEP